MKLFIAISLFTCGIVYAEGPHYSNKDNITQLEFENVYADIRSAKSKIAVIGEYVESTVSNQNAGTSNQYEDVTSISLTAGDWDVTAYLMFDANGATVTNSRIGISTTSGNSSSGLTNGNNASIGLLPTASSTIANYSVPSYRMNLTSTTTVYLKLFKTYSAATPLISARLSARRMKAT